MSEQSSNKRIAKNTVMLYIRMLISMVVGLYTSRVVLQTLGVEDYGIYGVVGGVVSMMGFLNASMAGATSRFITFELGRGDMERVRDTFSSALIVHMIIALIIVVVGETAGLWFLCNKLVIPEERMAAAHWVYQFSIISAAIGVTQAPYSAVIMSHEKMDIYAYFELLNVGLKLGVVYLLLIGNFDKLILYAFLTLMVSLFMRFLYRIYCIRHYEESHFRWVWNKEMLKSMASFSGWDLYGNISVTTFNQGVAFLLNIFGGPAINAANGLSTIVQGIIKGFGYNIIQAFRPPIIKEYAKGNIDHAVELTIKSTQYTLFLYSILATPLYLNADYVLGLWLGEVPAHTAFFLQIVLVSTAFHMGNLVSNVLIHANGRMKAFSLLTGSCFLLSIPLMYVLLKIGIDIEQSYYIFYFCHVSLLVVTLLVLKINIKGLSLHKLVLQGYGRFLICLLITLSLVMLVDKYIVHSLYKLIVETALFTIVMSSTSSFLILTITEREFVLSKLKGLMKRK